MKRLINYFAMAFISLSVAWPSCAMMKRDVAVSVSPASRENVTGLCTVIDYYVHDGRLHGYMCFMDMYELGAHVESSTER